MTKTIHTDLDQANLCLNGLRALTELREDCDQAVISEFVNETTGDSEFTCLTECTAVSLHYPRNLENTYVGALFA